MKIRNIVGASVLVSTIVGGYVVVSNVQNIVDWWRLKDYEPSAVIEAIAINTSMNDEGKKLFYVHNPELLEKDTFAEKCTVGEETIVLGCYITRQNIYIFDVEDERLEGVEEVTAAHEMLHAAYDRLTSSEKEEINRQLELTFEKVEDPRLLETLASYNRKDGSVLSNELHSILGTEVRDLPKSLEDHYSKYFDNRLMVVELSENYAEEFSKREEKIEVFDDKIAELQGNISRSEAELSLLSNELEKQKNYIEGLSEDPAAYNQQVAGYNIKVNTYNESIAALKILINKHNEQVVLRNEIALEESELVEAIDTRIDEL